MGDAEAIVQQPQMEIKPVATIEEPEPTPETEQRYKCHRCFNFYYERELTGTGENRKCPVCGEPLKNLKVMCKLDTDDCHHEVVPGIKYCEVCGEPICPTCFAEGKHQISHSVFQLSRVTGYLSPVSSWNNAKKIELLNRQRYNVT